MSSQTAPQEYEIPVLDKFHEIELKKVFETMLALQNGRAQLSTFFATANLAALSFGLNSQKAVAFFFAAIILGVFILLDISARISLTGYYYRGLQLQAQFAPGDHDTYLSMAAHFVGPATDPHLRQIENQPDKLSRMNLIARVPLHVRPFATFWLPISAILTEIVAGIIFVLVYNWSVF